MAFIDEFAKSWSLNVWDWLAVLIAFTSLLFATLSYWVAIKTLRSQKQTEKNTMPIINLDIQEFLLSEFIVKLFDAHLRLTALWYLLEGMNYKSYPSEFILKQLKLPKNDIHSELFYGRPDDYRTIQGYIEEIDYYNVSVDVLNEHLSNRKIAPQMLSQEFYNIIVDNDRLAGLWGAIMTIIFGYDVAKKEQIFKVFIEDVSIDDDFVKKMKYFSMDEVYLTFIEAQDDKKRLVQIMERTTINLMRDFEKLLIKK